MSDPTMLEEFSGVQLMFRTLAHRFARRHGGDPEELYALACLVFVEVRPLYDPARGAKLSTWLYKVIWRRFSSEHRAGLRRRPPGDRIPEEQAPDSGKAPLSPELREGMSAPARQVLRLALDPPPDITLEHRKALRRPGDYRRALRDFLIGMGWTRGEIYAAFAEIAQALRGE